jgi:glutamate-1-semialdehyde 2,1-aminomutase
MGGWETDEFDKEALESIKCFLPKSIIDIHSHIYRTEDLGISGDSFLTRMYGEVGIDVWRSSMKEFFGFTLKGALLMPMPALACDIEAENEYLKEQLQKHNVFGDGLYKGLIMISPDTSEDYVRQYLDNPYIIGFKPYYFFSKASPKNESPIEGYIPERFFRLADEYGLAITVHLVKHKALLDPDNYKSIVRVCKKYPNMKLVLAHAARGFHSTNTVAAIRKLRGIDNVYFDTALICEAEPIRAILDEFGAAKLMWGSDFPASINKGKYCSIGDSFLVVDESMLRTRTDSPAGVTINLIQSGIESLRAVKSAIESFGAAKTEIEDIFSKNAEKLFGYSEYS